MAVVIETTIGDFTIDLYTEERPQTCKNFLKLCKIKYYNFCLFHSIQPNFLAQTGDPSGLGTGGESVFGIVYGENARYYEGEKMPKIKHTKPGLLSMVNCGNNMLGSQFFVTLGSELQSLDEHCVFAEIAEGMDILLKLNETICDAQHRPYQDIRITHTVILHDPFEDLSGLVIPDASPEHSQQALENGRIGADEEIDDTAGLTTIEVEEMKKDREAKARATILEIVGDLPDAEMAPPENVLFVCKLNPVTNDDDLEIIFSRFGKVKSCEVIRDQETGDSLQYAFVEFEDKKACEEAYFKMDNVLIDDRRIHVDFSQSVAKMRWRGKGRGVDYFDKGNRRENHRQHVKDDSKRESKPDSRNSDSRKESKPDSRREFRSDSRNSDSRRESKPDSRHSDSRRREDKKYVRREESYDSGRQDRKKDFEGRTLDDRRRIEIDNHEHSTRNSKGLRDEITGMRIEGNSRNRYSHQNDDRKVGRVSERPNYSQLDKDPVTGKVWGEPFRVVDPKSSATSKVWQGPFRAVDTRRNDYQKREYDSGNQRMKDMYDRGEQIRSNENLKFSNSSSDRFRCEELIERKREMRVEKTEVKHSQNGHQRSRDNRARVSSPSHTSSPMSASRSKAEHSRDEFSSPLAGSYTQNSSVVIEQNNTSASPGTEEALKPKDKKAKKRKNEEEKNIKLKKKKKHSSSSNSDSSASSGSSDSDSSSSDSDSTSRKRKAKVRTTIAKKYYHKGKLVKIIKKKKDSSSDSDTDDSSDSDNKKKKRKKKGRKRKKIVKIIEKKKKKRKHDSSDDSESESSSSSSSSSAESDSDSSKQKKKRKLDAKKKLQKKKKEKVEKKKKKIKQDSSTEEDNEEDKNSQKAKNSTN